MAIEYLIKQGDQLAELKDFEGAVSVYTKVISDTPRAFAARWKRASAFQKLKRFSAANEDLEVAMAIAQDRGSREQIGICRYRKGLLSYCQKDLNSALSHFSKATSDGCREPALGIWVLKCEKEIASMNQDTLISPAEHPHPIPNNLSSISPRIRTDWYQLSESTIIEIYAKNLTQAKVKVEFGNTWLLVDFPTGSGLEYHYSIEQLFAPIDTTRCKVNVLSTKVEIILGKLEPSNWESLDAPQFSLNDDNTSSKEFPPALKYPTSLKKGTDWLALKLEDDTNGDNDTGDFFSKLYKDVDEDSRRAIMKSYVESNGTVLTTNWDEAKLKTFETSPPEGMVPKKWGT